MKPYPVTAIFKVVSNNYLDTTYYEYYYPERYFDEEKSSYEVLPNGVVNGFSALFTSGGRSRGKYDPYDTIKVYDPKQINIDGHSFRILAAAVEYAIDAGIAEADGGSVAAADLNRWLELSYIRYEQRSELLTERRRGKLETLADLEERLVQGAFDG